METLSNPVSTINAQTFYQTPHEHFFHYKNPNTSKLHPHQLHKPPNSSISNNKTTSSSFPHKNLSSPFSSSSSLTSTLNKSPLSSSPPPSPTIHRKPATGYAAALLDISLFNNTLEVVEKDVRRLSKLLRNNKQLVAFMNDPFVGDKEKGQVVKEVVEKGKFQKDLVSLLKMLVDKKKVGFGIVRDVLDEFERMYDEFSGTRVVLVSSTKKMEEDQLFGIAKRVQTLSGAMKVKVRHLVEESSPSFAHL